MSVVIKTAAANNAISDEDAKGHLRLEPDDESMDGEIAAFVAAATAMIETDTGLALIQRVVTVHVDRFTKRLALPVWPVLSVEEVRYVDENEEPQTLEATDYDLSKSGKPRCLIFEDDVLSLNISDVPGSIEIDAKIGFGEDADSVPADIRHAMKLLISHFDRNREAVTEGPRRRELPIGVDRLIAPHRVHF